MLWQLQQGCFPETVRWLLFLTPAPEAISVDLYRQQAQANRQKTLLHISSLEEEIHHNPKVSYGDFWKGCSQKDWAIRGRPGTHQTLSPEGQMSR